MTTLVTGATGHIGANLVRALIANGEPVRALVRRDSMALAGLGDVQQVRGDVLNPESLAVAMSGIETVFHLAGKISMLGDPDGSVFRVNVEGTQNVLTAALDTGVRRLVHCSSIHALDLYWSDASVFDETLPLVKVDSDAPAYDRSKAEGERCVVAAIERGLDAVIVNPTGVMGPCDFVPSRLGQVLLDLRDRRIPALTGGGFDFVDVRDVVSGMIGASQHGGTGENYILGNRWIAVTELAAIAAQVTGSTSPRFCCPLWLAQASAIFVERRAKWTRSEPLYSRESLRTLAFIGQISHQKAERELGFTTRPIVQTVTDSYQSFDSRNDSRRGQP